MENYKRNQPKNVLALHLEAKLQRRKETKKTL